MRLLLIVFLFLFACNKKVYLIKGKDRKYEGFIRSNKFLSVSCRDLKNEIDNVIIIVEKNNCDTLRMTGIDLVSRKPLRRKYYWYLISKSGTSSVQFTETEIFLLQKTQQLVDSLNWCQRDKKITDWKMIGTKNYLN